MIQAVTHNGDFHSDDIFASALLCMIYPDIDIQRSRDAHDIETADIVFDVGGIYDPVRKRFDHHQNGGAGERPNGIPYASFGLVWKEYGEQVCGSKEVASMIDSKLVAPIDAIDNGIDICTPVVDSVSPYSVQAMFSVFTPTYSETSDRDEIFAEMSRWAKTILAREIFVAQSYVDARLKVAAAYEEATTKEIIVIPEAYPISLFQEYADVLFVVYPDAVGTGWRAKAMRKTPDCFDVKKPFPAEWAGLDNEKLQQVTGVSTALFAHQKQFLVGASTQADAIALAKLALQL